MKKLLCILLAASMLLMVLAGCAGEPADEPAPPPAEEPAAPADDPPADDPPADEPAPAPADGIFQWDDFTGRDPQNKPDTAPNGASMWWDNWANLRANVEDGVVQINFQPAVFDYMDYVSFADYASRAGDWMGNWGEAIDMWSLDGISYCKYIVLVMAGGEGGEEGKLLLHFEPEDREAFIVPFVDLVTREGGAPSITTDMQEIWIDLEASGLPGMTNRMHIRAFGECTIYLDEIYFAEPIAPVDTTDVDSIFAGFTVTGTGGLADFHPAVFGVAQWNNYIGRDPQNKPETSTNAMPIWWDNWANLRAESSDDGVIINYRPAEFDSQDYDDMDDYYARAADWMGNWGEAVNMWELPGLQFGKYLVIIMSGAEGGEENKLMLHFQPEDGPSFVARFSDLVTDRGRSPEITTDMDAIIIDLEASGFPGMTNRMHIRAFAECSITLQEIFFIGAAGAIDLTDRDTIIGSIAVPEIGEPAALPIADFIAELE